jgi:hypothetical protein
MMSSALKIILLNVTPERQKPLSTSLDTFYKTNKKKICNSNTGTTKKVSKLKNIRFKKSPQ